MRFVKEISGAIVRLQGSKAVIPIQGTSAVLPSGQVMDRIGQEDKSREST